MADWISPYDCDDYDDYKDIPVTSSPEHAPMTTYESLLQAQLKPDSSKFLTKYEAMILAQFGTTTDDPSPITETSVSVSPCLNEKYLVRLHEMTLKAWPQIREGPEAEVKYYKSLLSGNKLLPETKESTLAAFGKLSQMYGPLPLDMEKYKLVKKETWTSSYRGEYNAFEGSDEQLLAQMAKAYYETKVDVAEADICKDFADSNAAAPTKTEAETKPKVSDATAGAEASIRPAPITSGHGAYDSCHEGDNEDDDDDEEENGYDHDDIFDDHHTELYGWQGYGGWD